MYRDAASPETRQKFFRTQSGVLPEMGLFLARRLAAQSAQLVFFINGRTEDLVI